MLGQIIGILALCSPFVSLYSFKAVSRASIPFPAASTTTHCFITDVCRHPPNVLLSAYRPSHLGLQHRIPAGMCAKFKKIRHNNKLDLCILLLTSKISALNFPVAIHTCVLNVYCSQWLSQFGQVAHGDCTDNTALTHNPRYEPQKLLLCSKLPYHPSKRIREGLDTVSQMPLEVPVRFSQV